MLKTWNKAQRFSKHYGYPSLVPRYVGLRARWFWLLVGKPVTRPRLQQWLRSSGPHILNLAGADHLIEGLLTVDLYPMAHAFVDMTEPLPFPNDSIDAIFCEEAIEHISKETSISLLQECFRVLKPRGAIRISTPDLDYFCAHALGGNRCDEVNEIFYEHHHQYLYTRAELENVVSNASFTGIKKSCYQDPNSTLGRLDSHADRFQHPPEISQYLEAIKPARSKP